jgi:hypothetical protein
MSNRNLEQRISFKLGVKLEKSGVEKCEILPVEYAIEALKKLGFPECHNWFNVGRESVEDTRRVVSTNENRLEENAEELWSSCCSDKQFSMGRMDRVSNLDKEMARKILKVICA